MPFSFLVSNDDIILSLTTKKYILCDFSAEAVRFEYLSENLNRQSKLKAINLNVMTHTENFSSMVHRILFIHALVLLIAIRDLIFSYILIYIENAHVTLLYIPNHNCLTSYTYTKILSSSSLNYLCMCALDRDFILDIRIWRRRI